MYDNNTVVVGSVCKESKMNKELKISAVDDGVYGVFAGGTDTGVRCKQLAYGTGVWQHGVELDMPKFRYSLCTDAGEKEFLADVCTVALV